MSVRRNDHDSDPDRFLSAERHPQPARPAG
jgi:hypothetical protein